MNQDALSDAAYWLEKCLRHVDNDIRRVYRDLWVRRILSQAARSIAPVGVNGNSYRFPDGSDLIMTSDRVMCTRPSPTIAKLEPRL